MNKQNSFSNKTIEALKMAIEALDTLMMEKGSIYQQALKACKEALAEAEKQEIGEAEIRQMLKEIEWCHQELEKQEWQSLSDDNILKLFKPKFECEIEDFELIDFARAIEQALKEKNT
jgi:hypothetical protein